MIIAVHQPQYIPWLGYFHKIASCDLFVVLDDVQYKKREFQNRNKIRTKDGFIWLTVPVITKGKYFQKIREVEIDTSSSWRSDHWKALELNYIKTPFFNNYAGKLKSIYDREWKMLRDLNIETVKMIMGFLGIEKQIVLSSEMAVPTTQTQRIVDICRITGADTYLSGAGGKEYMDEGLFADNQIKLNYQKFVHPVYPQYFKGFQPYMSALDLIFNCGPDSYKILTGGARE